jgi:transposase-like protein
MRPVSQSEEAYSILILLRDDRVKAFPDRPIEGGWPYPWIDAACVKMRPNGRIVSTAVTVALGVNADGRREVLGMDIGPSEAEPFWTAFLRKLARRGLCGVKRVASDAHEGIKASVAKILTASRQRCRVHFTRNALAHAGKSGRRVVSAFIATAFARHEAGAGGRLHFLRHRRRLLVQRFWKPKIRGSFPLTGAIFLSSRLPSLTSPLEAGACFEQVEPGFSKKAYDHNKMRACCVAV